MTYSGNQSSALYVSAQAVRMREGVLILDGQDDYFDAGDGSHWNALLTGNFTIEEWIYLETDGRGTSRCIFNRGDDITGEQNTFIRLDVQNNDTLQFKLRNAGANLTVTGSDPLLSDQWIHFSAVRQVGLALTLYVNGQSYATANDTLGTLTLIGSRPLTFGAANVGSTPGADHYFSGMINNLRMVE
ncbi:MAG: hypothetical protein GKR87_06955 [Kiritimatiellae bacterium]|nr:hypothetical protein [Kiritimatiellia bacterium]